MPEVIFTNQVVPFGSFDEISLINSEDNGLATVDGVMASGYKSADDDR